MNRNTKLSIIIPCYNGSKFIGPQLDSLLKKDEFDRNKEEIEIIVVNDGSTDTTHDVVKEYSNVNLVDTANRGVSSARNTGLENSHGEFVLFLDCDDRFLPDTISFLLRVLNCNDDNIDVLSCGYISEAEGKTVKTYSSEKYNNKCFDNVTWNKLYLSKAINVHIGSVVFRREFLLQNSIKFDEQYRIGEDMKFFLQTFAVAEKIQYFSRICFAYQIRSDSVMKGYKNYSIAQFQSFLLIGRTAADVEIPALVPYYNLFVANSYITNLIYYYRSDVTDQEISDGFKKYKSVLRRTMAHSNVKWYCISKMIYPFVDYLLREKERRA